MCVSSMVSQHYFDKYPDPYTFPLYDYPNYQELLRKARLYDEIMKQRDCPDPKKEQWNKELDLFMTKFDRVV